MSDSQRLYLVTRSDLPAGLQAAQAAHAAFQFSSEFPELTDRWMDISNYLVILAVPDEAALDALRATCVLKGMDITVVREPDLDNALTALAIEPTEAARKLLSQYPLALRERARV